MNRTTITAVHDIPVDRTASFLLLYARSSDALVCACRQLKNVLASCRGRHGDSFATGRLLGAWPDAHALAGLPQELTFRRLANTTLLLSLLQSFSLWGIWSVASIEMPRRTTHCAVEWSRDMLDALHARTQHDTERPSRYSTAFACDTRKQQFRTKIKRLITPIRFGSRGRSITTQ